ncbi:AraC family transcriptional regulator [Fictibacillus sp. S7]|uniref:AraC family transcriptional regulator n=1 Tax=Fictibacillus sp. S7 TaxID=2212476 RepID=UPI0010106FC6|nr:AraC family transcriptional regulator [Fictibacillus sp. S7]RXZ00068.1 AraC family transcriptional regulator [Fictibacillus sp. S7]
MLNQVLEKPYGNSVFQYRKKDISMPADRWYAGWELQTSSVYRWNGNTRNDGDNTFIFQYTTKGEGRIRVNETTYSLLPGDAFLVDVPSDHEYLLPDESSEWEFMFITLVGESTKMCWEAFTEKRGPVQKIPYSSRVIQLLHQINQEAANKEIKDAYMASSRAYEFIMALHRFGQGYTEDTVPMPESLQRAITHIHQNMSSPLHLEELAAVAGLSKFYFIQLFQSHLQTTPMQYVTKKRIEQAMAWLSNSTIPVKEISRQSGFDTSNYFSKVFRRYTGESPSSFRERTRHRKFTNVFLD